MGFSRCSFVRDDAVIRGFLRRRAGPPLIISCKNSKNSGTLARTGRLEAICRPPRERARERVGTAVAWLKTPAGGVAVLILATLLARLLFAAALGLGIDESYMVAAGRKLQLSYFDHPPIAWWMAWGAAHLTGSESAVVVRLPFIALFALTTFLMYRVTSALFNPAAGLWAAVVLNVAPVLGITAGTWVLPDGPLFAALLGYPGLLDQGVAFGRPPGLGLVVGGRRLRGPGALFQIFGRPDPVGRRRVPGERTDQPPLADAAAPLRCRHRRVGDLPAGADLECRAPMGLVSVPGGTGRRFAPPVRADIGDRRSSRVSPPLDMGALGVVRLRSTPPRSRRPGTLVAGLSRRAANFLLQRGSPVGQRPLSLGGAGLSDAAAVARGSDCPSQLDQPAGAGLVRWRRPRSSPLA